MSYLQSNLNLLAQRQPDLAKLLSETVLGKVELFTSASKRPSANYRLSPEKLIPLHSKYDPLREARAKLQEYGVEGSDFIVLLGFGLGYLLDALLELKSAKSKHYFIIESDPSILRAAFEAREFNEILSLPSIRFAWPVREAELAEQWSGFFDPVRAQQSAFVMHPPSLLINPECFKAAAKTIQSQTLQIFTDINTLIARADEFLENFIRNIRSALQSPGVSQFAGKFRKLPAIIVSAGPSLDKNIHELRPYRDGVIILSTDTALKPLLKVGIEPHFVLTGDPSEANYLHLKNANSREAYIVAEVTAHPDSFREFEGRTISCTYQDSALGSLCDILDGKGKLRAWGSVATMAFDFALLLGCDPVIFIGQDLAYSDSRTYCTGVYFIENFLNGLEDPFTWKTEWEKLCRNNKTVPRQDIFGKPILTTDKLASYWMWFVRQLSQHNDVQFINATEGGIFKENAAILSLREALYRYCSRKANISKDIHALYAEAARSSGADRTALLQLKNEFEQIRRLIERGKSICKENELDAPVAAIKKLEEIKAGIYSNASFAGIIDAFNQMSNIAFLRKMTATQKLPKEEATFREMIRTYSEYFDSVANASNKISAAVSKIELEIVI